MGTDPDSAVQRNRFFEKLTPYLFISPWILGFLFFTLGPYLLAGHELL